MTAVPQAVEDQAAFWNGRAGRTWVEAQETLDGLFRPLEERLAEAVSAGFAGRVLDVGCGTGAVTLAVARRLGGGGLGGGGRCLGLDISAPMLAAARARADREGVPADFVEADAQTHALELAAFDLILSRFGLMFFADPVAAFANLRRAARDGGGLRFAAWRGAAENPFMTTAERAAAPLLPDLPVRRPEPPDKVAPDQYVPGQFAFADPARVRRILEDSGWTGIEVEPLDVACRLPESELVGYFTRLGPLGRLLAEADEATRARVVEIVRPAFEPYVEGSEVRFTAACWLVTARAPGEPAASGEGTNA